MSFWVPPRIFLPCRSNFCNTGCHKATTWQLCEISRIHSSSHFTAAHPRVISLQKKTPSAARPPPSPTRLTTTSTPSSFVCFQQATSSTNMSYTLYGFEENTRTRVCQITAKYEGVDLKISKVHPYEKDAGFEPYVAKFPHAQGKIPALEGAGVSITECVAICHYLSSIANKANLLGSSKEEAAEVLQWMVYINSELLIALSEQWLFLPPANRPYNKANVASAEKRASAMLDALEQLLLSRTFLVGQRITLADIFLANALVRGFATCLDASFRSTHPNVLRHFNTIVHQPNFLAVLGGEPTLTESKVEFTPPKKEKAAAAPKAEKKKEKKDDEEEEPLVPAEPKAKHPCEALGSAKCFPFDEWKRQFSNSEFPVAMKWLEENIDLSEYSFWKVTYKYHDELTQVFMSANLIGGFHSRLEASRKYLFGSAGVYGKTNASKIQGAYMIRGSDYKGVFDVAPDWESYDFEQLDFKNDIEFIKGCWNWDNTFDGLEYADGKVFK
ncbi:hypothetical protein MJO29_010587 [Puccinia striiformis f. sp. tritici]|nr:hypothetical protein Pst134EA_019658 [Puccinia striiformis f. sp. tritici]KAH9459508.1 hypothetical protein Pst134EA_019658 [Puccinia striiformis f. sp. tritici]KAI7948922.1 hypothetical protein MJO29_010587 [Puccinia striiformis f. sp. tritici]KAI9610469.1 hypothetical protein H4Q26_006609 [Puccinia striiformis f. sp. tritici PST-130]